jgi:DNA polymerase III sliding clamp (beta) subunit (PCNA family)
LIIITRRLAKRLKTVFRQALSISGRGTKPIVQLAAGSHGLRIRCGNGRAAVEFRLDGEQPEETLFIPFDLLSDVDGGRETPVEIRSQDGKVTATWRDGAVPRLIQHDGPKVLSENWPPTPEEMIENRSHLLSALHDASETTDSDSVRYALGCIQLRGESGKVVATDGRQILVQAGYTFPWKDDILLPSGKIFGSAQLPDDEPVFVGQIAEWFTLRVGPWTIWLTLHSEGRFPDTESHIGRPESAVASFVVDPSDARFLLENVSQLPGDDEYNLPVTVDLNGHVAVRANSAEQPRPTELVLSASRLTGEPVRMNMNRCYLKRAMQLGFRKGHVFGPKAPVLCQDDRRSYLWALLNADSAVPPHQDAIRIESSKPEADVHVPQTTTHKRKVAMPESTPNENGRAKSTRRRTSDNGSSRHDDVGILIEQAEGVKTSLRETLAMTAELVSALKQHRKQSKAVRVALASLRELQPAANR